MSKNISISVKENIEHKDLFEKIDNKLQASKPR